MKIILAPDSFKGSISGLQAARAMADGARRAAPDSVLDECPLSDGGEGLVEAMVAAQGGTLVEVEVEGPLGKTLTARYGMLGSDTAVIEMAAASGLPLVKPELRNPMKTSTFGTGQLLLDAANRGARRVLLGIGGSATVDGGTGMARALGVRFLDETGAELAGGGEILEKIRAIDMSNGRPLPHGTAIAVACDVTNPLTGPEGAARVYGPQKGATPSQVESLDAGLANLAAVVREQLGMEIESIPGAGAAGGLGAGLMAFAGANLESGIEMVLQAVGFDERLEGADLVLTGEGRVDGQSAFGKVVSGVAAKASLKGVPVVVVAGALGEGAEEFLSQGVTAAFSIARGPAGEEELMADAEPLLADAAENALRLFLAGTPRGKGGANG